ncbi:hypothetical protein, partial [Streptomyces sp. NPDC000880]
QPLARRRAPVEEVQLLLRGLVQASLGRSHGVTYGSGRPVGGQPDEPDEIDAAATLDFGP